MANTAKMEKGRIIHMHITEVFMMYPSSSCPPIARANSAKRRKPYEIA